jgi:hypothetical protein
MSVQGKDKGFVLHRGICRGCKSSAGGSCGGGVAERSQARHASESTGGWRRRIGVRRPQLIDSDGYNDTCGRHRSHFYAVAHRHFTP